MKNHNNIQAQKKGIILLMALWLFSLSLSQCQEIVIPKESVWKYLDSGQNMGTSWYQSSFDDNSWLSGPGILGFGEGDEGTVLLFGTDPGNKTITTYFRKAFTLGSIIGVNSMIVRLMRDDGAIVYLNGNQLLSSNMPDDPDYQTLAIEGVGGDDERYYYEFILSSKHLAEGRNLIAVEIHQNDPASSDLSFDLELETSESRFNQIRINEILPSNVSNYLEPDFNQFQDWIELFNPQQTSLVIGGYYLTDNLNIPKKWQIPEGTEIAGNSYLIIIADGLNEELHTSYSLARKGERLGLFTPDMVLVDSISYPPMFPNVSYGIMSDGETRGFFGDPTPLSENTQGCVSAQPASEPSFSKEAGFYAGTVTVILSTQDPQATIRYTTDGSDPNQYSDRYEAPLPLVQTTVMKARVYVPGVMPSMIITKTFFIQQNHDLPVISIVTNSDFLDDSEVGIYRQDRLPERREWERPGTLEFFEADGSLGFQVNIDYRLFGRGAIYLPQKSLAIFIRNTNGYDGLNYDLFPGTSVTHFQSFILRSSSDDWRNTMFRDGMIQTLLKDQVDFEYQDYRPAVLYINGEYMGIHNIRDKLNEDYLATHKAVDPGSIDLIYIDNDYTPPLTEVKSGDDNGYWAMWNFITQNSMINEENYRIASTLIDIDNYQDYCCIEIITGNRSWLHNRRVWKPKTPDGKFRYLLFDLDYGYIFLNQNILSGMNSKDMIFKSLMKNPTFKAGLIQKLATYSRTVFDTGRVLRFVDSLSGAIRSEIPRHSAKWGSTYSNIFTNLTEWESRVQVMRDFTTSRPAIHEGYIQSFLGQPGKSSIDMQVIPPNSGNIYTDNVLTTSNNLQVSYSNNLPIKLRASANSGYRFAKWQGTSSSDSIVFSREESWKYNDSGTDLGMNWFNSGYDDSGWGIGNGPLGYGNDHIRTTISYGGDSDQKHPAYYFRKEFSVQDISDFVGYFVRLMRDDGAILYLNGVEQFRVNMPEGTVKYSDYSSDPVWGGEEELYFDYSLNLSDMVEGNNILAVEIHQETGASYDVAFDLELIGQLGEEYDLEEISLYPSDGQSIIARFYPNTESDIVISEIFYRPTSAQGIDGAEYIELVNTGTTSIDLSGWSFTDGIEFTFPQGTSIESGGIMLVVNKTNNFSGTQVPIFEWTNGFLSNIGEVITMLDSQGLIMDQVNYGIANPWPTSVAGFSIELGDLTSDNSNPTYWSASTLEGGTPGAGNSCGKYSKLKINEIVGLPGDSGYLNGTDWIEIVNTGTEPIDIGGLYLSDELLNPLKFMIPDNDPGLTTVDGGGYIVLIADGLSGKSTLNLGFKLNANEGAVVLSETIGESFRIINQVQYAYLPEGQSYGRSPDGTGLFENQEIPTPGAENTDFSPNIIAPYQISPNDSFPVIVRITDQDGNINREVNTTLTLSFSGGLVSPDRIKIRHGVGTLSVKVNTTEDFILSVDGYNYYRKIRVNDNIPRIILQGPITESKFLLSGIDYIINSVLRIESGAVLHVMPGVRLLVDNKVSVLSKGLLKFEGTCTNPIVVMPKDNDEFWGGIEFQDLSEPSVFNWTIFTGGGADSVRIQGHSLTEPVIYAQSTKMLMDQCFFVDNIGKAIYGLYSELDINNSVFSRCDLGLELAFCYSVIKNSWLIDLPDDDRSQIDDDNDGIYYKDVLTPDSPPNILESCVIYGVEDDGVDMSKSRVAISDCIFARNYEKGISAGWRSDVFIERSLFLNNYVGVSSTFWTPVTISHSTFYKNYYALYSSYGGGGVVNNSILSEHKAYYANDSTDAWFFEYCLSDSDPNLVGKSNISGEPGFVNKGASNFHLTAGSLAINAGNPELRRDADGTPSDLGMFPYDGRTQNGLVISEIYYNPPASQGPDDKFEFIEIINPGAELVDISGYRVIDGISYTFRTGTSLSPGEILIVAADAFTYNNLSVQVFEWDPGKLSNGGERIGLVDANGQLIDEIIYLDTEPWPELADGDGFSMELPDAFKDNSKGSNWVASSKWGGSPGDLNFVPDFSKISLNEIMVNDQRDPSELFLGFSSWLEVYNAGMSSVDLGGFKFSLSDGSEYLIPVGSANETTIPLKGYSVFFFDSKETYGANHIPLSWNGLNDKITLSRYIDQGWNPVAEIAINGTTSSLGRYPDGSNTLHDLPAPSPGTTNSLASPDLVTMKTVMSGERMPIILLKENLTMAENTERNAQIQVVSGSANFNDTNFPMIEGVGSVVAKVTADSDFKIEVGEWQDTVGIRVDDSRHIFHLDNYVLFDQVWTPDHDYYIDLDLEIRPDVTVTVLPGTRIFLKSDVSLDVSGSLKVLGTRSNPVLFAPQSWYDPWGQISIKPFSGEISFNYTIFIGGGGEDNKSDGHTDTQAVISSNRADVKMTYCFLLDNPGKGIYVENSNLNLRNSLISRSDAGVEGRDAYMDISNSYFTYIPTEDALGDSGENDAVFSTGMNSDDRTSRVMNCVMAFVRDDALDYYDGASTLVSEGRIQKIGDKAVSVTGTDLDITYTLIQKSDEGLVAKEQAVISADHLTFFQNTTSLHAYTNDANKGHGRIEIENSILSSSNSADLTVSDGSSIVVNYTMSDNTQLSGTGNILGNPLFINPNIGDFFLQTSSPAIDTGNPSSPLDADGSRTDLGAFIEQIATASSPIVINEIMYAPKSDIGGAEYIEIYNSSSHGLDISGYYFGAGVDFEFPPETIIAAGEYIIITKQSLAFQGNDYQVFEWESGGLSDSGEAIRLMNKEEELVDFVLYGNSGSWPSPPNGKGPSLELKAAERDNSLAGNWRSSYNYGGTPGIENSSPTQDGVILNEVMARNHVTIQNEYGEYVDWLELYNPTLNYIQLNGLFISRRFDEDYLYHMISGNTDELLLAPGEYKVFWLDNTDDRGSYHVSFELAGSGGFIAVSKSDDLSAQVLDSISYPSLVADVSYGRIPDGADDWVKFDHPTPGISNTVGNRLLSGVYINEILARNSHTYLNDIGEYDDWIEIYNSTNQEVDLGGLYFSDNADNPLQYKLPLGSSELIMEPKSFLMLFPSAKAEQGARHLNFQLAGDGEHASMSQIYLGETYVIDSVTYPAMSTDMSYARMWDGGRLWNAITSPTPNESNGTSAIRENELPEKFVSIFPNPVYSDLNVSLSYTERFNYRITLINVLNQEILIIGHDENMPGFSTIKKSWSLDELGIKHSSFWLLRLQINEKSYYKKLIMIRE